MTDPDSPIDEYDAIARRFFAEFLKLKVDINLGRITKPPDYERELREERRAAKEFKEAAAHMASEVRRLEEQLALAEERLLKERAKLNEALIALNAAHDKLSGLGLMRQRHREGGYAFVEHLDPESRRVWESLMRAPGSTKDPD